MTLDIMHVLQLGQHAADQIMEIALIDSSSSDEEGVAYREYMRDYDHWEACKIRILYDAVLIELKARFARAAHA